MIFFTDTSNEPHCDRLKKPENGNRAMTGTFVGATTTFRCDDDFTLIGQKILTCVASAANPVWSHEAPKCQGKGP